jgi:hypothetical protein
MIFRRNYKQKDFIEFIFYKKESFAYKLKIRIKINPWEGYLNLPIVNIE